MSQKDILDVSEADFEYEVINYSLNIPVIVDFWAEWCKPCKELEPILRKLISEASGAMRLARVDVDHNPNLVMRYSVRSIPAVKAFSQAEVVAEFTSLQPEHRVREFLARIAPPSPLTLAVEKGNSLLDLSDWASAEAVFHQVLSKNPDHPAALLGLAKTFLATNRPQEAQSILQDFPESRQYPHAEALKPLAKALLDYQHGAIAAETDLDSFYLNALRLVARQNIPAALDGLLEVIRESRTYRGGLARSTFLGLLELLGENNPLTRRYRSELASILF